MVTEDGSVVYLRPGVGVEINWNGHKENFLDGGMFCILIVLISYPGI